MTRCSAPNCHNAGGHLFPKTPKLRQKWLSFAEKPEVGRFAVICKSHFLDTDFHQLALVAGLPTPRQRLKPTAVPSVSTDSVKTKTQALKLNEDKKTTTSFKYETQITTTNGNDRKQCLALKIAVLSDSMLLHLIELIKSKLVKNAPPTAQFPSKWSRTPTVKTTKVREGYPPFSMACLVAMAIESSPDHRASKRQIFAFISTNFPCYKMSNTNWQKTVESTIELYKVFKKVPNAQCSNQVHWTFSPDRKTVISPEVYEAFTDPRYDESKIDFSHAIIQTDFEIVANSQDEADKPGFIDFIHEPELPVTFQEQSVNSDDSDNDTGMDSYEESSDVDLSGSDSSTTTLYKCSFCKFTSPFNEVTSSHLLNQHPDIVVYCCKHCDYLTPENSQLKAHSLKSHPRSSKD